MPIPSCSVPSTEEKCFFPGWKTIYGFQKRMKVCVDWSVMSELFESTGEHLGMRSHINYRLLAMNNTNKSIPWRDLSGYWKKRCKPVNSFKDSEINTLNLKGNSFKTQLPSQNSCIKTTCWLVWTPFCSPCLLGAVDNTRNKLQVSGILWQSCSVQPTHSKHKEKKVVQEKLSKQWGGESLIIKSEGFKFLYKQGEWDELFK